MADITTPQVISFVNQKLRPAMDRAESAIRTLRQLKADYAAGGYGPLVAGTVPLQQSTIDDGAVNDGRTVLLGYDVDNAVSQANALLAYIDSQSGMEAALIKPSVNNAPLF